ncbi:MAG: hypothetical protein ACTSRS_18405 [Candidatus Helarchaeota archaeon]
MSDNISKAKERVLQRLEDRKRMLSTFIVCTALAAICILFLILFKTAVIDLNGTLSNISRLLPGLIRVLVLIAFFALLVIGIANLREYYTLGLAGLFDIISIMIITVFLAYFLFDFPTGIADTMSTLGGCVLLSFYFYFIQD